MAKYVERAKEIVAHQILQVETYYGPGGDGAVDILTVEGFENKVSSNGIAKYVPGPPAGGYLVRSTSCFGYEYISQKTFENHYMKAD